MFSHADALHWAMSHHINMVEAGLPLCRNYIKDNVLCATGRRQDDLVLHLFIEATDDNWHLDLNGQPNPKRKLFSEYLAAGYIKMNEPVAESTSRIAFGSTSLPPPEIFPLELAMRMSSVATVTALLDEGADESRLLSWKTLGGQSDLLMSARLLPDNPDVVPMMVAAVTESLMRRRIAAQNPTLPVQVRLPGRRSMSV